MRIIIFLLGLSLQGLSLQAADLPKDSPTPLTPEEVTAFHQSAIRFLQARVELLEALINERLGVKLQRAAEDAANAHAKLVGDIQEKHKAKGCGLSVEAVLMCPHPTP